MSVVRLRPGPEGHGVELELDGRALCVGSPVMLRLADGSEFRSAYGTVVTRGGAVVGTAELEVLAGCAVHVRDEWTAGEHGVFLDRVVTVQGGGTGAFVSSAAVPLVGHSLHDAEPFLPGVIYGDATPVPVGSLGSPTARAHGLRELIVREDRAASPVFALRAADSTWVAIAHLDPRGGTVAADGEDIQGEPLVDARLDYGSLGAIAVGDALELGFWFPGTEGEFTYESGGLPLRQLHRPRQRYHPLDDGLVQRYRVEFRAGRAEDVFGLHRQLSAWMWESLKPEAEHLAVDAFLRPTIDVLASQVQVRSDLAGIALESDPTTGRPLPGSTAAVMGFVGANTDAAAAMLRASAENVGSDPDELRRLGCAILDAFARLPPRPAGGEGFDLETGAVTTYRTINGEPVAFLRSMCEGWAAALRGYLIEEARGATHALWREWAVAGAEWLLTQLREDGHFPRSWGLDGRVIDNSTSSSALAVPFLLAVAAATGETRFREVGLTAAEASWRDSGSSGAFAGATLDNPDVVDKEASIMALEAYLAAHLATGADEWLARARGAAIVAETWIHLWDIPMAVDGDATTGHWKRTRPTTGMQLITSGVTMSDGFLQVNAAAFALLGDLTGEAHWLDVARLVHHGSKAMLAVPGRLFDLAGPGWQQEHWGFATNRGRGLNRSWLPWTAVATIDGVFRLRDLPRGIGDAVLR
jgi:hypothetical protein